MLKRTIIVIFVFVIFFTVEAVAETPKEGAHAILKLLENKNYSELFQHRYSEWYKVKDAGVEPKKAIQKLMTKWEKNYEMMVKLFEKLSEADFDLTKSENHLKTETGDVATAKVTIGGKEVPYRLYKMNNGLWGFHM